jgi:hypothetical protein
MDGIDQQRHELKRFLCPVVKTLGSVVLRRSASPMSANQEATLTVEKLYDMLSKVDDLSSQQVRRRPVLFVEWSASVGIALGDLFDQLFQRLNQSHRRDLTLAEVAGPAPRANKTLMAMILKTDTASILTSALQLPGCTFTAGYIVNAVGRRDQAMHAAVSAYCGVASAAVTNLWLDEVPGNTSWGLEQLVEACSELDDDALLYVQAQIKLTAACDRDEFQRAFMKLLPELRAVRAKKGMHTACSAITAKNVQQMVQSRSAFIDGLLDLEVCIPDQSLCPGGRTTLREYCEESNMHQNLTLLMHGPTRLGKTEAAKMLAFALSSMYLDSDACVFFLNTIDSIRSIQQFIKPGHVLLLDELDGGSSQLVHSDCNMFKVLLNPVNSATVRGRNDDIELPPRVLRVLTSNAESIDAWAAQAAPRLRDRDALTQRLACCHVSSRLYSNMQPPAAAQNRGMLTVRRGFDDAMQGLC